MLVFSPQPYLGALSCYLFRGGILALVSPRTHIWAHPVWNKCPTQRCSAPHTRRVLRRSGSASQGRIECLQHRPCCPDSEWGSPWEGAQAAQAAEDLVFKYSPLGGLKLTPLVLSLWISFLPKTESFPSPEEEKVPPRGAVMSSGLEDRKALLVRFFSFPFFKKFFLLKREI